MMFLIPRFTTEEGRLEESEIQEGAYEIVPSGFIEENKRYPYKCAIKSFTWFGFYYDYSVVDIEEV